MLTFIWTLALPCPSLAEGINLFKVGDGFIESNNEASNIENVGKKPAILHMGVISVVGMTKAINKIFLKVVQSA